jgi:plastocyanin
MNKTTKIIAAVVLVAVIAGVAIMFSGKKSDTTHTTGSNETGAASATITFDGTSFSPDMVAVASGGTVKVVNNSTEEVEPASDPHPTHTDNPEINFEDIAAGQSKTVTVTTKGTWGYHNHHDKNQKGTIVVE